MNEIKPFQLFLTMLAVAGATSILLYSVISENNDLDRGLIAIFAALTLFEPEWHLLPEYVPSCVAASTAIAYAIFNYDTPANLVCAILIIVYTVIVEIGKAFDPQLAEEKSGPIERSAKWSYIPLLSATVLSLGPLVYGIFDLETAEEITFLSLWSASLIFSGFQVKKTDEDKVLWWAPLYSLFPGLALLTKSSTMHYGYFACALSMSLPGIVFGLSGLCTLFRDMITGKQSLGYAIMAIGIAVSVGLLLSNAGVEYEMCVAGKDTSIAIDELRGTCISINELVHTKELDLAYRTFPGTFGGVADNTHLLQELTSSGIAKLAKCQEVKQGAGRTNGTNLDILYAFGIAVGLCTLLPVGRELLHEKKFWVLYNVFSSYVIAVITVGPMLACFYLDSGTDVCTVTADKPGLHYIAVSLSIIQLFIGTYAIYVRGWKAEKKLRTLASIREDLYNGYALKIVSMVFMLLAVGLAFGAAMTFKVKVVPKPESGITRGDKYPSGLLTKVLKGASAKERLAVAALSLAIEEAIGFDVGKPEWLYDAYESITSNVLDSLGLRRLMGDLVDWNFGTALLEYENLMDLATEEMTDSFLKIAGVTIAVTTILGIGLIPTFILAYRRRGWWARWSYSMIGPFIGLTYALFQGVQRANTMFTDTRYSYETEVNMPLVLTSAGFLILGLYTLSVKKKRVRPRMTIDATNDSDRRHEKFEDLEMQDVVLESDTNARVTREALLVRFEHKIFDTARSKLKQADISVDKIRSMINAEAYLKGMIGPVKIPTTVSGWEGEDSLLFLSCLGHVLVNDV